MAAKKANSAKDKKDSKAKGKDKGRGSRRPSEVVTSRRPSLVNEPPLPPPLPPKPDPCESYVPDEALKNVTCRFNDYPGLLEQPKPMSIVASETGCYQSLLQILETGLRCADRVLLMAPWGNYVIFRANHPAETVYFLYDGCTCNVNSFRHLDLREGAAGFITFDKPNPLIAYILNSRYKRKKLCLLCKQVLDDICVEKRPTGEDPDCLPN